MGQKKYWKGLDEKNQSPEFVKNQTKEFPEELPVIDDLGNEGIANASSSRRDFLKMLGFSVTAATVAASCEMPVRKSIPYVVKPDEITPGVANYYASTFFDGANFNNVLVKTREGRPIKIEGNELSELTAGGTDAISQASVLNLYDQYRLKGPKVKEGDKYKDTDWASVDAAVKTQLEKGGQVRILSSTIISPSFKKAIAEFTEKYPNTKHVTYDAISYSGLLNATAATFGTRALPDFRFDKANLIVSVGADFLGSWLSPVEFSTQYGKNKQVNKKNPSLSRHIQVESTLSLAGSNADQRIVVRPSEEDIALLHLYNEVAKSAGGATVSGVPALESADQLKAVAAELLKAKGKSLVVSGSNSENAQVIALAINSLLGNVGTTLNMDTYSNLRQGSDAAFKQLVTEMNGGGVDTLILVETNPVYSSNLGADFASVLSKVGMTVSISDRLDETAGLCSYVCPVSYYLESWGDAEPKKGYYSLTQPTIAPLFDSREAGANFLAWAGNNTPYYDYIKQYWYANLLGQQNTTSDFNVFWDRAVHDGVFKANAPVAAPVEADVEEEVATSSADPAAAGAAVLKENKPTGTELVLYQKVGIRDGKWATNPWLHELPDPISKICWDNYAAMSPALAEELGLETTILQTQGGKYLSANLVKVSDGTNEIVIPAIIQPGTAHNTVAIALGYGRTTETKMHAPVGVNAYPFAKYNGNTVSLKSSGITIEATGEIYDIAQTQSHHTITTQVFDEEVTRPIVKETTLAEYKVNPSAGNEDREEVKKHLQTLYGYHDELETGHHWNLAVDLSSCIGCGACSIACTSENNVPTVGKDEVRRSREMHWMRIDRYYSGDENNPSVIFQPMMCQHCDNAPCENVCPVSATNHSSEGLNQMAYNRCIGTRYCANNCPYKVRRFNWFDYHMADTFFKDSFFDNEHDTLEMTHDLTRMVMNPDVTVRSRGVMEKCSFCVQRIQEGKLTAKKEGRKLQDGDIKTACQTACPTNAITFGDYNDKESAVRLLAEDERAFKVIEEIHTLPSVNYLTKVRNKDKEQA